MDLLTFYACIALLCGLIALVRSPETPRHWLLLVIAAVPQIGLTYGIDIPVMVLVSAACVALWGIANARSGGLVIAALGMLMNLLAMAMHGGRMPISAALVAEIGWPYAVGDIIAGSKDVVVATSPLLWLSDHLVVDMLGLVASPGDVVVLLGILWWLARSPATQRRHAHARTASSPQPQGGAPALSPRR